MSIVNLSYIEDIYLRVNYVIDLPYLDPSICESLIGKLELIENYVENNKDSFEDNFSKILMFCSLGISILNVKKIQFFKIDFQKPLAFVGGSCC
jgi:hypothetical protein